jgi:hypothetical protein
MKFDSQKVWANARQATTEDLLDRVTVFREGMEPEGLAILEAELRGRGVTQDVIETHGRMRGETCLRTPDGTALKCSFCHKPAVVEGWGWLRFLWGMVPIFPRRLRYCQEHRPDVSKPGG